MPVAYGADTNQIARILLVDAQGQPLITQTDPSKLVVGNYGYISGAWKRQGLIWSYADAYLESVYNLDASAGDNVLTLSSVPSGEVWVIQTAFAVNVVTTIPYMRIYVVLDSFVMIIAESWSPTANHRLFWSGQITLKEGASIKALYSSCAAGDDIYLGAMGYKMQIGL